ncbi:MAG TPA: PSD1 and planctomycete cytochrome C domain-containing protein, partial [Gemmataceae bacterium]|nr:PSD1 and planctomycete cytochrome C domain-containing protein [Gemmataceae bacterium]
MRRTVLVAIVALVVVPRLPAADNPKSIDYSRDVQPILTASCYACHGPDEGKRKGKFRLDVREAAVKKAIKPGDAEHSALIDRVTTDDPDRLMPPPDSKKDRLTAAQIDVLRRWVAQGAKFDQHWAYVKPVRTAPPAVKNRPWVRNPVDAFVAAGQEAHGFAPAPEADRVTLIRRLSFDLIGLPPTPDEVDAFVNDRSPDAYEKLVDRLLASEHYGEHMAEYWLDAVRYADTGGYHSDNHRDVWLFRDYVINAFNANKRFDQCTVEQLAGDLLPHPTNEQRIASGYNRLLQTTEEGGAQAKEYTAKYAADRVRNVSSVWMASTMGCCECHNHKFDPFTTRDFYSLEAFFADVQEKAVGRQDQTPIMTAETAARVKLLDEQIALFRSTLGKPSAEIDALQTAWEAKARAEQGKGLPKPVADALAVEPAKRTPQQKQALTNHYRGTVPELEPLRKGLAEAQAQHDAIMKTVPTTLVTTTGPPRVVRLLHRGNWQDDSGDVMRPAVPGFLASLDTPDKRPTRLDLARWVVSPDNPLTARAFVNRLWKICFGQGIVKSLDDFGIQGSLPSHPALLDWLAVEFVESGWDVKHVLKLLVMSNAYRQSSTAPKEVREKDPANVWLARQGRFRLDAEMLRDNALEISGLLSRKVGGPSVKPYQPAGYWSFLNFPVREWQADKGENLYRRGLYTYWCRTFLHPSLLAFDAPTREECTVERTRSSTPLQALVLLNDPIYVEAARVFAERIVKGGGNDTAARLDWAYRRAVSRHVKPEEAKLLTALYEKHLAEFRADRAAAEKEVSVG